MILLGLLLLLVGGYILWSRWQRKKQNAQLRSELQQSATAAPRGCRRPDLAKLDNLRKKFDEGVETFRSPPAKTSIRCRGMCSSASRAPARPRPSAIATSASPRACRGDNDRLQGAGGTLNMNWWFTNQAVILDTAGRLMFEEVEPGETNEWQEFLKLLKNNRPNCPINGMLLVIPADSSSGTPPTRSRQGRQDRPAARPHPAHLGVRFPVFVIITKCDLINGFREFFDDLNDPQLQHQMMGWSNPDPLDAPFRPDIVESTCTQVAERLRRRRLGLLLDPVPEDRAPAASTRSMRSYALPTSITKIAPAAAPLPRE